MLLYRHKSFTGKYTAHKMHTKPHPRLGWIIFGNLPLAMGNLWIIIKNAFISMSI